jgi:hypothetical protein
MYVKGSVQGTPVATNMSASRIESAWINREVVMRRTLPPGG